MTVEETQTFVPGHITGFFSSHPHDDPLRAGSRGAGITITDGVTVRVRTTSDQSQPCVLNDVPIEAKPVSMVLNAMNVTASVSAETPLQIGAGFGVSGALALGTAVGANQVCACGLSENELVRIAHGAEVLSSTGMGDVVAQARGGVPIRLDPGAPGYGTLDGIPVRPRIEYLVFGELSTETILSGDTTRLNEAGKQALSLLVDEPTLDTFMYASRRFAREAGLLTDHLRHVIEEVSAAGGDASMAMLGRTVFALETGLSDAGFDPSVCTTHPTGVVIG